MASLLTDFLLKVLGEKFDEPKSSPATPSSHAAMGKFKYFYIFQLCFLELYVLDQVKCQLFYLFYSHRAITYYSTSACETPLFYTTPSSGMKKMKTCK